MPRKQSDYSNLVVSYLTKHLEELGLKPSFIFNQGYNAKQVEALRSFFGKYHSVGHAVIEEHYDLPKGIITQRLNAKRNADKRRKRRDRNSRL